MKNLEFKLTMSILESFFGFLARLNEEQIKKINDGTLKVEFFLKSTHDQNSTIKSKEKKEIDLNSFKEHLVQLQSCKSREEGEKYIEENFKTKKDLMALIKLLDLPLSERTKKKELVEKIIEATIGFKIRSLAIQGKHHQNE